MDGWVSGGVDGGFKCCWGEPKGKRTGSFGLLGFVPGFIRNGMETGRCAIVFFADEAVLASTARFGVGQQVERKSVISGENRNAANLYLHSDRMAGGGINGQVAGDNRGGGKHVQAILKPSTLTF